MHERGKMSPPVSPVVLSSEQDCREDRAADKYTDQEGSLRGLSSNEIGSPGASLDKDYTRPREQASKDSLGDNGTKSPGLTPNRPNTGGLEAQGPKLHTALHDSIGDKLNQEKSSNRHNSSVSRQSVICPKAKSKYTKSSSRKKLDLVSSRQAKRLLLFNNCAELGKTPRRKRRFKNLGEDDIYLTERSGSSSDRAIERVSRRILANDRLDDDSNPLQAKLQILGVPQDPSLDEEETEEGTLECIPDTKQEETMKEAQTTREIAKTLGLELLEEPKCVEARIQESIREEEKQWRAQQEHS